MPNYSQNSGEDVYGKDRNSEKSAQRSAFSRGISILAKAGVIFAVLVLAILIVAWILGRSFSVPKPPEYLGTKISGETVSAINTDSDDDNLKDWEETIYHTDPKNTDTDGDGTKDGEEIAQNRNPLKAGPDDGVVSETEEKHDPVSDSYRGLKNLSLQGNLTQAMIYQVISKNGIDSFLKSGQTDAAIAGLQEYIEKMNVAPEFSAEHIADTSLTITNDNSNDAIKRYFNSVADLYKKILLPIKKDDLEILQNSLQSPDNDIAIEITPLIDAVTDLESQIKKIAAPRAILLLHKKELFYLSNTIQQLELLKQASSEDPLYLMLLMRMRIDLKKKHSEFRGKEIPSWLKTHTIVFRAGDSALIVYPPLQ